MRVIICGGRGYRMDALDWRRLDALHAGEVDHLGCHGAPVGPVTTVYEGGALGADTGARFWARSRGIPHITFAAQWDEHGLAAGPMRNMAMLAGHNPAGVVEPAELVVAFPGGVGTADMVAQARHREVPVLDLRAPRAQRWNADHISDLNDFANYLILGSGGRRSVDDSRAAAVGLNALAHGGLGVPCCSAHLFRVPGTDEIRLPPGSLYVGRPGMLSTRTMKLPPDGDGSILGNPVSYPGGLSEEQASLAMEQYRSHLRGLYRDKPDVRALLDRIAGGGTLLVCWCHTSKPCHTTVIAESALLARASRELRALGRPRPPPDLPVSSARSRATPPASSVGLFAGAPS